MTDVAFLHAYRLDAEEASQLFESMTTERLCLLHLAHAIDQQHADTPASIAFGAGRLALIARVLARRGVTPPTLVPPVTFETPPPVGLSESHDGH